MNSSLPEPNELEQCRDFFATNEERLARYAARALGAPERRVTQEEVADALAESFLRAAQSFLKETELKVRDISAWCKGIIFYTCLKQRSRKGHLTLSFESLDELEQENDFLCRLRDALGDVERRDLVDTMMTKLSLQDAAILRKSADGLTSEEIAPLVQLTAAHVRQRRSRSIAELRRRYKLLA